MLNFFREKWPYFIGFAILEAVMYYLNGTRGQFLFGIAGMFTIWMYYAWTIRDQKNDFEGQ
jgi:hypothetical protein